MKTSSYRDRLVLLALILVFVRFSTANPLEMVAGVFLVELLAETILVLWTAADAADKRRK